MVLSGKGQDFSRKLQFRERLELRQYRLVTTPLFMRVANSDVAEWVGATDFSLLTFAIKNPPFGGLTLLERAYVFGYTLESSSCLKSIS